MKMKNRKGDRIAFVYFMNTGFLSALYRDNNVLLEVLSSS